VELFWSLSQLCNVIVDVELFWSLSQLCNVIVDVELFWSLSQLCNVIVDVELFWSLSQLNEKFHEEDGPSVIYAISMAWFKEWENFVRGKSDSKSCNFSSGFWIYSLRLI
jgi:uncharacterized damage-inducible protein DinB